MTVARVPPAQDQSEGASLALLAAAALTPTRKILPAEV